MTSSIKKRLKKIFIGDIFEAFELDIARNVLLLRLIFILSLFIFVFFFFYEMYRGMYFTATLHICAIIFFISMILFSNTTKKTSIAINSVITFFSIFLLVLNLFTNEVYTSALWTLAYPYIVIFLIGKKRGIVIVFIFLMLLLTGIFVNKYINMQYSIEDGFLFEFISSFVLMIMIAYFIELIRERTQDKIKDSKNELAETLKELQETHAAYKESEEKYKFLFEKANDAIIIIQNQKIVFLNDYGKNLLGMDNNIIGMDFIEFIHPDEKERVMEFHLTRLIKKSSQEPYETIVIGNKGSIYVEINAIVINYLGNPTVLAIIRDISNRKYIETEREALFSELERTRNIILQDSNKLSKMNDELLQSEEYLKDAIANKDKFFSILSHDLKNPIFASSQLVQLLNDDYHDISELERREILEALSQSSKSISELLNNLLEWAGTQTGSISFSPELIKLTTIINETCVLLKTQSGNKKINIIRNFSDDLIVFADINMLRTVLRNLVSNAFKFTGQGGKVVISAIDRNDHKEIHISDSGIGISNDNIEKLFRIENRISTLGTNAEKGTGLGLILCKEFIEIHSGHIWVESQLGKGSIFKFILPNAKKSLAKKIN